MTRLSTLSIPAVLQSGPDRRLGANELNRLINTASKRAGGAATVATIFLILMTGLVEAVPNVIGYQGHIETGGVAFTGNGQFKFALVNATGDTTFWSHDGTSTAGSAPRQIAETV